MNCVFEDAGGKQEVFLHAQKDMNTVVQNDKGTTVGANHTGNRYAKPKDLSTWYANYGGSSGSKISCLVTKYSIVDGEALIASAQRYSFN